jgi:hypothetical protein
LNHFYLVMHLACKDCAILQYYFDEQCEHNSEDAPAVGSRDERIRCSLGPFYHLGTCSQYGFGSLVVSP